MRTLRDFIRISPRFATSLEFFLYALLTAFALHATWLTWPDAYIDFSRELYLPWRVSCGDVLYRDLAYDFGPLSVYANAALFALLGRPSIHALFALNFAFWLATLLALRALLRRLARPAVATIAISCFILLFSFNRYIPCGNFNFLAPYSHELPRGFLLSLLSLLSLDSALRRKSAPLHLLSGFLLGLALFTKPEIAIAALSASAILFFARFHWGRGRPARDGETPPPSVLSSPPRLFTLHFSLHAAGAFCAVGMGLLPLSLALGSFSQALRNGLIKLYLDCFNPALAALPFYRNIMGINEIPSNVLRLLCGAILSVLPCLFADIVLPRLSSRPLRLATIVFLALLAAALGFFAFFFLNSALPLAPVLFAFFSFRERRQSPRGGTKAPSPYIRPLALAFAVFALALVSKILLHTAIAFYGFVLALPAFCCAILLFFRFPCPPARAAIAAALLAGFSAMAFRIQAHTVRAWDIRHLIHDRAFLSDAIDGKAFAAVLGWLRTNTAPDSTLAVLPEGAILNVLSRRPNPTPYVYLSQGDWLRFGESSVLAAYSNSLPDTLVLVRKPQDATFGIDYAQSLMALLSPLYEPVFSTGSAPSPSGPVPYLLVATRIPPPP